MSAVTTDLVWYPPEFLSQGRLPSQAAFSTVLVSFLKQLIPMAEMV